MVRTLFVIVAALLLAFQIVRNALVQSLSAFHSDIAAQVWPGHPAVEISQSLVEIARDARNRRSVNDETLALMNDAARKAPLAAEPFLVRGVQAQSAGDSVTANRAFLEAQWRDPRSVPAAYFLADYYFRRGLVQKGLRQTTSLVRLVPGASQTVAPFVALYAHNSANWPQLRALFKEQPELEADVLSALAKDPRDIGIILAIADPQHRRSDSPWFQPLLQSLVAAGEYREARSIWSSVSKARADQLLYDENFSSPEPPPPFNWSLTTSKIGLAERQPGNRLHLFFYGNEDGVLASQLIMLEPGLYNLKLQIAGSSVHPEAVRMSVRCDKVQQPIVLTDLDHIGASALAINVPQDCPAQWLEFAGRSADVAQQADVTITQLALTRSALGG